MFNCNTGPIVDIYVYKLERNLSTVNEYYEYISIAYMEHSIEEGKNVYDFYKDYQKSKKIGTNETGESIINVKNSGTILCAVCRSGRRSSLLFRRRTFRWTEKAGFAL